jgi:uncharacterized membrane protein
VAVFHDLIASSEAGGTILEWIEFAALAIEVLAVAIIVVFRVVIGSRIQHQYRRLKVRLGRALLLGLEILVAADIVRTVALEATLQSVAVLGLLVLIRTFLSWALVVEIEGRWPWQPAREERTWQALRAIWT